MISTVKCKQCGNEIEVSEALTHQIQEQIVSSLKSQHQAELESVVKTAEKALREKITSEIELASKNTAAEAEELKVKNKQLQNEVLSMAKSVRDLKDLAERQEIENQKKLNAEMEKIRDQAIKLAMERSQNETQELRKQLEDTKKALESANYKASQSSQQMQGELLELDLEKSLHETFPTDQIDPIGKGVQGADIIHHVKGQSGREAGVILWETKDAKWSPSWLPKLREDARKVDASVAVLVCKNPPTENSFQILDGVVVTSVPLALPLAALIRRSILQTAIAKQTASSKDEKLEVLYEYLQSESFRHRFESFAEGIKSMHEDLDTERRAMERSWKRREVQAQRMMTNAARMYGELQGVMGDSLPEIKTFSLPQTSQEDTEQID